MSEADSQDRSDYVTVPERHAVALSWLSRLADDKQRAIYQAASTITPSATAWDSLKGALDAMLSDDPIDNKALTAAMMGLFYARQRASDLTDSEFVQAAVKGVQQAAPKDKASTVDLQKTLVNVLALDNLELSYRAGRVRYDSAYHFHDAGIVTDIRPIFNVAASSIQGAVISHILKIDYASSSEDSKDLYLAVDDSDLGRLEAVIKRARRKAIALHSFARDSKLRIIEDKS